MLISFRFSTDRFSRLLVAFLISSVPYLSDVSAAHASPPPGLPSTDFSDCEARDSESFDESAFFQDDTLPTHRLWLEPVAHVVAADDDASVRKVVGTGFFSVSRPPPSR